MALDCIVVGAGAAGIGAGLALQQHGASFVILESKNRLGGRGYSEELVPGQIFDHGCHWFHSANINPLREIALKLNHPFTDKPVPYASAFWQGGKLIDPSSFDDDFTGMYERVIAAGKRGQDIAVSEMLDRQSPWIDTIRHDFSLSYSQDVESISTLEAATYNDTGENIPVSGGYGALIAKLGGPLPVRFNSKVSTIEARNQSVRVATPDGVLEARAVIVAVPQSVLSRGLLKFLPGLPTALLEAIDSIPMGNFEKTAIAFDRPVFGELAGQGLEAVAKINGMHWPISFSLGSGQNPIAVAHIAGQRAREMSVEDRADCCEEALVQCFGTEIRARIVSRKSTNWRDDSDIGGAYSCARPGYAHMRKRLLEPAHGRIFLAGEHTSLDAMATAHGAYLSGQHASQAALDLLAKTGTA